MNGSAGRQLSSRKQCMETIELASVEDAEAILRLQQLAYQSEARFYQDWSLPPLTQTLDSLRQEFSCSVVLKALWGQLLVGSVRARQEGDLCTVHRLIVHPDYQRRGIGSRLLRAIEDHFPAASRFELFTGSQSLSNLRLYQRYGYSITHTRPLSPNVTLVFLSKPASCSAGSIAADAGQGGVSGPGGKYPSGGNQSAGGSVSFV